LTSTSTHTFAAINHCFFITADSETGVLASGGDIVATPTLRKDEKVLQAGCCVQRNKKTNE